MAKEKKPKKPKPIIYQDCIKCRYSKTMNDKLYCKLRLQYEDIPKDSGIVSNQDCNYFLKAISAINGSTI